ncbi:MAG: calcium-translocating P-type ATPase, PMCA-type [Ruminococcaceae bacterium]|nr:calcium-translocating P-type ATPase, PMCA-type [Oscillospiraceae bacterium]
MQRVFFICPKKGRYIMNGTSYGKYKPLNSDDIQKSRSKYGDNTISEKKGKGFFRQFISNFNDPVIKILLVALGLNLALIYSHKNWYETLGIVFAILISTFVSTVSEYGSEMAFKRMKEESDKSLCRVIRDHGTDNVPLSELVVGDIVCVSSGEKIPADGIIISGELSVDQSALNGESKEVFKYPDGDTEESLSSRSFVCKGSIVSEGEALICVKSVGDRTFYGAMANEMQDVQRESPLKLRLSKLARFISKLGYICAVLVAVADLFVSFVIQKNPVSAYNIAVNVLHAFTLGITVVVMAVPEGLPMMITVVLSRNMFRMQKDKVLVRKLVGIETAGNMNVLFTDKTGTLTKGNMSVASVISGNGTIFKHTSAIPDALRCPIESCAIFCNSATAKGKKAVGGNSTDRAIMEFFLPSKLKRPDIIASLPFSSITKYSAISYKTKKGKLRSLVKGAPEILIPGCTHMLSDKGEILPFDAESVNTALNSMTKKAMRVLAVVSTDTVISENKKMSGMCFVALICIRDELRREARKSVEKLRSAGVSVIMMTGDSKATAAAIAKECGILKGDVADNSIFNGKEISEMSDEELKAHLPKIKVISRALPSDKSRLVRIAQDSGYVCGMTGDGVNDAPALKKADVGFAMGNGTDIAKDASDIVILDSNISSIAKAVLYGRAIFQNIRKFIVFQLTVNLAACVLSIICPLLGIETPISVMQMLWVNMIMDTFAALAFAGEAPAPSLMHQKPLSRDENILSKSMCSQILWCGIYICTVCLAFLKCEFFYDIFRYDPSDAVFMTGFFALFIFFGIFSCFNTRVPGINLFKDISKNPTFIFIIFIIAMIQLFMIYSGSNVFRCVPLSIDELKFVIYLSASVIPFDLIRKIWRHFKAVSVI